MNSYKRVLKVLKEFSEIKTYDFSKMVTDRKYANRLYKTFLPWLVDPIQTPDAIIHLLTIDLPTCKGVYLSSGFKRVMAFYCLCALVERKPIIEGSWESLVYIIIEFTRKSVFHVLGRYWCDQMFKAKKAVVNCLKGILMLCSPNQCPNPCLRLELISLNRIFKYELGKFDQDSPRFLLINALCDLCDMYSYLSLDQIHMSVDNLYRMMCENSLDILSIMHMDQPDSMKTKLVGAIIKITGMFTRLEKERSERYNELNAYHLQRVNAEEFDLDEHGHLYQCSTFLNLIPTNDRPKLYIQCFINAIHDKPILVDLMIDTYRAIDAASIALGNPYNKKGIPFSCHTKLRNMIIYMFYKRYVKMLPMQLHCRQVNGGFTLAKERQLTYFSKNARPSAIEEYDLKGWPPKG